MVYEIVRKEVIRFACIHLFMMLVQMGIGIPKSLNMVEEAYEDDEELPVVMNQAIFLVILYIIARLGTAFLLIFGIRKDSFEMCQMWLMLNLLRAWFKFDEFQTLPLLIVLPLEGTAMVMMYDFMEEIRKNPPKNNQSTTKLSKGKKYRMRKAQQKKMAAEAEKGSSKEYTAVQIDKLCN